MPRPLCPRPILVVLLLALLPASSAVAQLTAPSRIEEMEESEQADDTQPSEEEPEADITPEVEAPAPKAEAGKGKPAAEPVKPPEAPAAPVEPAPRPTLAPLLAPQVSNDDLLALWKQWQQAYAAKDAPGAEAALRELLTRKEEVEAADLEPLSMGLLRAAEARRTAGDAGAAAQLTEAAVALSPDLPAVHFASAEALARRDATAVGRYLGALKQACVALWKDPRHRRLALADLGAVGLFALVMTAVAVVGVLFARRARYLLHDFHHFLPRALERWQSALLALLLLAMPVVLRLGVVPVLVVLLASVAVYLSVAERAVAWGLLALLGVTPLAAQELVRATSFAGSVAEDVYLLERGGLAADEAGARVRARLASRSATFAELFALGRFEARRGALPDALAHYKAASALRSGDVRLLTNWGNALLASGDTEGAQQLYATASRGASLPAPAYNLAMVLRRKAKVAPDEQVSGVLNQAREAYSTATDLDPSLLMRDSPPEGPMRVNQLVMSLPLPASELEGLETGDGNHERVAAQLTRALVPGVVGPVAWGLPALAGGLLFGWGFLRQRLNASKVCEKCGRSVCRRCDPELGVGSQLCTQCVNVFARKGLVPPQMRARKQEQVDRHQAWMDRVALVLGALASGAGHVFAGLPLRGALYLFLFLLGVGGLVLHPGLLRAPYGAAPALLKLALVALVLLPVYLLTLRGLRQLQNE
ncbi:hypothetical protein P2318_12500 [Myxococcaceae bacterium GXIMD 01537]